MQIKGVEQRTAAAKAALNRLHQEVQFALEEGDGLPDGFAGMDLAEVLAIAVQIGRLVDQHLPAEDPRRHKFELNLQFMQGYHEVPR